MSADRGHENFNVVFLAILWSLGAIPWALGAIPWALEAISWALRTIPCVLGAIYLSLGTFPPSLLSFGLTTKDLTIERNKISTWSAEAEAFPHSKIRQSK